MLAKSSSASGKLASSPTPAAFALHAICLLSALLCLAPAASRAASGTNSSPLSTTWTLTDGDQLVNDDSIDVPGGHALEVISGSASAINNQGAVLSGGPGAIAIAASSTLSLDNAGSILATAPAGAVILAEGLSFITNSGLISGGAIGISLSDGGEIINSGTISATAQGVLATGAAATLLNAGLISGHVSLSADAPNSVTLAAGSLIEGNLLISSADSTLTLHADADTSQLFSTAVTDLTTFTGTLIKTGAGLWELDSAAIYARFSQQATLVQSGTLAIDWPAHKLNTAPAGISADAELLLRIDSDTHFTSPLTGDGLLRIVNTSAATTTAAFSLSPASLHPSTPFSGTLALEAGATMHLGSAADHSANIDALAHATLRLNPGSTLHANDETGKLNSLQLNGGSLSILMNGVVPAHLLSAATLSIPDIAASAIIFENYTGSPTPVPNPSTGQKNWLDQDSITDNATLLVAADTLAEPAPLQIAILKADSSPLSDGHIIEHDDVLAHYNYTALTSSPGDAAALTDDTATAPGLYYDYVLTELNTKTGRTLEITTSGATDNTLSAALTGDGGVRFTTASTIILTGANTHTGASTIATGTLVAGIDNALGQTSWLEINATAALDLGDHSQTIGGGRIDGLLLATPSGSLGLAGLVEITSANPDFAASVGITGSTTIHHASSLGDTGTLSIPANAALLFRGASGDFQKTLAGDGALSILDSSAITLATDNPDFEGAITIEDGATLTISTTANLGAASIDNNGSLILANDDDETFSNTLAGSGVLEKQASGVLALPRENTTFTGRVRVTAGTLRLDIANALAASSALTIENATLDLNNHNQELRALHTTSATIRYSTPAGPTTQFTTLLVSGALEGASTHLMNVDIPNALSDQLIITGAASGQHHIIFTSVNTAPFDDPARTHAIQVITCYDDDASFTSNTIESGMSSYQLFKGDGGLIMPDTNAYYLSAGDSLSRAADAILFTAGVLGADWHYELDSFHRRLGEMRDSMPGDNGSIWMRSSAHRLTAAARPGGAALSLDSYGLSAGGDKIYISGSSRVALGLYAAGSRSVRSCNESGIHYGDGNTNSIGAGAYALWLHNAGLFADATVRFDRCSNTLNTRGVDGHVSNARYTNRVQGLSLETGWRRAARSWWVEPSAQIAYAWINDSAYTVANSAGGRMLVTVDSSEALQYRMQVRVGTTRGRWMPHVRIAGARSDTEKGVVTVASINTDGEISPDSRKYKPQYDGWRLEAGIGAAYLLNTRSRLYMDFEYAKASHYERPWTLSLGYRRNW